MYGVLGERRKVLLNIRPTSENEYKNWREVQQWYFHYGTSGNNYWTKDCREIRVTGGVGGCGQEGVGITKKEEWDQRNSFSSLRSSHQY